jgi:hypothetical protein
MLDSDDCASAHVATETKDSNDCRTGLMIAAPV